MAYQFIILLCIIPAFCISQKHDNIWIFGEGMPEYNREVTTIDFSDNTPQFILRDWEGCFIFFSSSMSDSSGRLLFYTSGCHLYDASGKIMKNGDTLNSPPTRYWKEFCTPPYPSFQLNHGAFALPRPNHSSLYDLFHIRMGLPPSDPSTLMALHHTTISTDTSYDLGMVMEKDRPLVSGEHFQPAAAVRHGNGRDWWIIIPTARTSSPVVYRFLLTPEGVSGPWLQKDIFEVIDSSFYGGAYVLIFTPDGSKLIQYHIYYGFIVYDFDRCVGLISNPRKVLSPYRYNVWDGLDCEVSLNSRYLYAIMGQQRKIVQYDLSATNISVSADTVAVYEGPVTGHNTAFGWMARAPDGKIYFGAHGFHLHVIEYPDLPGLACNVRQHAVKSPSWLSGALPYFPNYRLYDLPNSPCDTLGIDSPVSVQDKPEDRPGVLRFWPNPTSETLHVVWSGLAPVGARVLMYDVLGRLVLSQAVSEGATEMSFSVADMPVGVYTVWLASASAWLGVGRVSVSR